MDVLVKVTVPNPIYKFYSQAAACVAGSSPENIMSDALCAYAGLLSQEMAKALEERRREEETASPTGP